MTKLTKLRGVRRQGFGLGHRELTKLTELTKLQGVGLEARFCAGPPRIYKIDTIDKITGGEEAGFWAGPPRIDKIDRIDKITRGGVRGTVLGWATQN